MQYVASSAIADISRSTSLCRASIGQSVTEQENNYQSLGAEQGYDEVEKHPLMIWTGLTRGDLVSLHAPGTGEYVGTVECRTSDGLIIWIRDALNDRRLFHYNDCHAVRRIS